MFHQQGSAAGSRLQGSYLLVQQFAFGTACLPGSQGVVYLAACIQQCLLEGKGSLLLLGTGYAVLRNDLPRAKSGCVSEPTAEATNLPGFTIIEPAELVQPALPPNVMEG